MRKLFHTIFLHMKSQKMSRRRGHEYSKLSQREFEDDIDGGGDGDGNGTRTSLQYSTVQPTKIPWKAILLAACLCIAGSVSYNLLLTICFDEFILIAIVFSFTGCFGHGLSNYYRTY